MSLDIVLFSSTETIKLIEEIAEDKLVPIDFSQILEKSFPKVVKDERHRSIEGKDFSIDFSAFEEPVSNIMLSLHGENGLFEIIELAKEYNWQIFDTALGEMIDRENPAKNGFKAHSAYVNQIMKK